MKLYIRKASLQAVLLEKKPFSFLVRRSFVDVHSYFLLLVSLHKVQNRFESVLYLVENLDGVFVILILLVFKKNDSLFYQLAVLYG